MSAVAAPVKGIVKAFETGIKLAKRVCRSTSSSSAAQALQIFESANSLQKSLERSSEAITRAYGQYTDISGEAFASVLVDDGPTQSRLKDLRIELIDSINDCPDFEDEPESFDPAAFTALQGQSERISSDCLQVLKSVADRFVQESPRGSLRPDQARDDRTQLASMRSSSLRKPVPSSTSTLSPTRASPVGSPISIATSRGESSKPRNSWTLDSPAQFELDAQSRLPLGTSLEQKAGEPSSPQASGPAGLIHRSVVDSRVNANDDFLERRRQSRIAFQKEMGKPVFSIDEDSASNVFPDAPLPRSPGLGVIDTSSPILGGSTVSSPTDARNSRASLSGYGAYMTRQRSQGQASQTTRSSRTSSILQDFPAPPDSRARQNSDDSIFGLRQASTSASSNPRSSGSDGLNHIATTLKLPGFGSGVEDGLEVVTSVDYESEKIPVLESDPYLPPSVSASITSTDTPMGHDTSFYRFGGFCEGARALIRGEEAFKIVKRPSGHYSATVSARCIKCSYEVGWNDLEKDRYLDKSGIYGNSGIRFRQRFITKCHLRTTLIDEPVYSCIFCIEEHKTVEEHDATVFFTVPALFRHLATHPRPLPNVGGINVVYGQLEPGCVDFDVHFIGSEPVFSSHSMKEIAPKVAVRPSAVAIVTHHPKSSRSNSRDPEGNLTMSFAAGAKIVGITFPARFGGAWCVGYHDGERGSFPASAVSLDLPAKVDVLMNSQSSLIAYAKWDFKPKDAKEGGWLKFSRGDKICCIGYTFQDQWCWSGQNQKGKWGLFPTAFVEGLQDRGILASSPGSVKHSGSFMNKLSGRTPSFPLGRKKSERGGSIGSPTNLKLSPAKIQPGLEVVVKNMGH